MSDLSRFKKAQKRDYQTALNEIKSGHKQSHWIWYIFPQLKGLGFSEMSQYYGISSLSEAQEYMADEELSHNLIEISQALLQLPDNNPTTVMGYPDDMKLHSSMTLFSAAAPDCEVFTEVLDKFYGGKKDKQTLIILDNSK